MIDPTGGDGSLRGGKGADVFWFQSAPNSDEVADFSNSEDLLDILSIPGTTEYEDMFALLDTKSNGLVDGADAI